MPKKYWKNQEISGPNGLSKCPESREMDFGPFRGNYFLTIFRRFLDQHFFEKMNLRRVLWPKCQVKKVSYIDPLVMRFSPKSEFLIGNFHQILSFLVKPYFLFLQYRKSVLKKTQIFGPLFEPCSSCVAVDSFFFRKNTIPGKKRPSQRDIFRENIFGQFFDNFLENVGNLPRKV